MVRIALNLDEIQAGRQEVENGRWRAKLESCDEADSSTGNPMLVWDWKIAEGPSEGATIRSWTSLQDHALSGFKTHAEAFGYKGDTEVDTDACVGKYAILVIGKRKRKNRDTMEDEEVSTVVTVQAASPSSAAAGGVRRPGVTRVGGGSAAPARRAASTEMDDLPF